MLKQSLILVTAVLIFRNNVYALDNELALTPPMGWLSWERFRCVTNCEKYPTECISEQLYKDMADVMASEGYADLGYEYVMIDDCWLTNKRDENGKLVADPKRFPSGIKALAEYIHSRGLKFGIYEDYGFFTCAGYPGSMNSLEIDANTFAEWDVDYVKFDGCFSEVSKQPAGMAEFGKYLNQTGRRMVYMCEYPFYQETSGVQPDYAEAAKVCNLWRNYYDVEDTWNRVREILNFYKDNQDRFQPHAGPGHWNDPDMLIIGNYGLSYDQSRAQMALWAILASPLIMSADLRTIKPEFKAILQNKDVIAINQDRLGIQGRHIYTRNQIEIYTKPVEPIRNGKYSYAIAFLSTRTDGAPTEVTADLNKLELGDADNYEFENVFDKDEIITHTKDTITVRVNPTGVILLKATRVNT